MACEVNFSLQLKQNLKSLRVTYCHQFAGNSFGENYLPCYEFGFSVIETDAHTVYWCFLMT